MGSVRVGVLALVMATTGCASFASFQEMDTLAKGDTQVGAGATVTGYQVDLGGDDPQDFVIPALNVWVRQGITDRFEGHGRVWLPLGATVGGKYQLLGSRDETGFGLSSGLDVGYLSISSGGSTTTVLDTYVPVNTGYRFSEGFATYLSPKYMLRTSFGDSGAGLSHHVGGTLGLAAGKKSIFYLEGSGVHDLALSSTAWSGGLGVGF